MLAGNYTVSYLVHNYSAGRFPVHLFYVFMLLGYFYGDLPEILLFKIQEENRVWDTGKKIGVLGVVWI